MNLKNNIERFQNILEGKEVTLVAVSKTKPVELIREAYDLGLRTFGENKAQELAAKQEQLPEDIRWHMIGHLQRNKVKYLAPFVSLIESVDSLRLLREINKQARKNERTISCLLQVHIAREQTKFGFDEQEVRELLQNPDFQALDHVKVTGLMGMATFTSDMDLVRGEFRSLRQLFDELSQQELPANTAMETLSMGMSGDYEVAIEEGSTMIRVGTSIFGAREKH